MSIWVLVRRDVGAGNGESTMLLMVWDVLLYDGEIKM
jgi:hypothetical protein